MDYEQILEQIYSKIISKGDQVIDIGAHSGRHTKPMVSLVGNEGNIYAFEPNPGPRKNLEHNVFEAINNGVVCTFPYALSDVIEKTQFIVADDRPEESGLLERQYNGPTTTSEIDVEVITLDSISERIGDNIKFIKIDVEGAEFNVLRGAYNTIQKNMPFIAFEFGECSYKPYKIQPGDVYDYLTQLNYKVYSILGNQLDRQQFIMDSKVQNYWDYIACPNKETKLLESIFKQIHKKPSIMKQILDFFRRAQ